MLCQGHAASTNGGRADLVVKRYSAPEIAIVITVWRFTLIPE